MKKAHKEAPRPQDLLFDIASDQQGYFTSKQAIAAGFVKNNHPYYVKNQDWIREGRGVYRLRHFPYSEDSELVLWSLWSRNRNDAPQAVYSHQTALRLFDLSDLAPSKLHMTVPKRFRKYHPVPKGLVIHHAELQASEWEDRRGYRVTLPLRTLKDISVSQEVSKDFFHQARQEALERGLVSKKDLKKLGLLKTTGDKHD